MLNLNLKRSFLFLSCFSLSLSAVDDRFPVFYSPYSVQSLLEGYFSFWDKVPTTFSTATGELINAQMREMNALAGQEARATSRSRVFAGTTGFFSLEYKLLRAVKALDALFDSTSALTNKASARRVAEFLGNYSIIASRKIESTAAVDEQKYLLFTKIIENMDAGINRDWSSDSQIVSLGEQLKNKSDSAFRQWLDKKSNVYSGGGYGYSDSSTQTYSTQTSSTQTVAPQPAQSVSSKELTGFYDYNNVCQVCKYSFEKGTMVAPFSCASTLHLIHPRCTSGLTKCPAYGCGKLLGSCSAAQQEACVICLDPLFGQYLEVTAVFSCAKGSHKGRSHLLHEACARNLLTSNVSATCPECRAPNINMV